MKRQIYCVDFTRIATLKIIIKIKLGSLPAHVSFLDIFLFDCFMTRFVGCINELHCYKFKMTQNAAVVL